MLGKSERSSICKYYSGEEFIDDLELEFDLVFLDMQMGEIDGITAAIKFRKRNQDAVLVFCTGIQLPQERYFIVGLQIILVESIRGIDNYHGSIFKYNDMYF